MFTWLQELDESYHCSNTLISRQNRQNCGEKLEGSQQTKIRMHTSWSICCVGIWWYERDKTILWAIKRLHQSHSVLPVCVFMYKHAYSLCFSLIYPQASLCTRVCFSFLNNWEITTSVFSHYVISICIKVLTFPFLPVSVPSGTLVCGHCALLWGVFLL